MKTLLSLRVNTNLSYTHNVYVILNLIISRSYIIFQLYYSILLLVIYIYIYISVRNEIELKLTFKKYNGAGPN